MDDTGERVVRRECRWLVQEVKRAIFSFELIHILPLWPLGYNPALASQTAVLYMEDIPSFAKHATKAHNLGNLLGGSCCAHGMYDLTVAGWILKPNGH